MKKDHTALITIILFLLNAGIVVAAPFDLVNQKLRWIFFSLPASTAFAVWLKFSFFVIIFAALYNGGLRALKAEGPMARALGVISFIIALTTAIFVPYNLILYIFKVYGVILVILFAVLPVIVGLFISKTIAPDDNNRGHRVIRGAIYILLSIFLFGLIGHVQENSSPLTQIFDQVLTPLWFGAFIIFLFGVYNLVMAVLPKKKEGDTTTNTRTTPTTPDTTARTHTTAETAALGEYNELGEKREAIAFEGEERDESKRQLLQGMIREFIGTVETDEQSLKKRIEFAEESYTPIFQEIQQPTTTPNNPRRMAKQMARELLNQMLYETDITEGLAISTMIEKIRQLLILINNNKQYPYIEDALKQEFEKRLILFFELQKIYVELVGKLERI